MTDKNPITGDKLISKLPTKEYEEGYDRIFGKKTKEEAYDDTWKHEIGTYGTYGKDDGKEMV